MSISEPTDILSKLEGCGLAFCYVTLATARNAVTWKVALCIVQPINSAVDEVSSLGAGVESI